MTVNKIETVQDLIEEMQADGAGVGSAWEFTNAQNNRKMFAVFATSAVCDIFDSPFVQKPNQIWAEGKYIGNYAYLNYGPDFNIGENLCPGCEDELIEEDLEDYEND